MAKFCLTTYVRLSWRLFDWSHSVKRYLIHKQKNEIFLWISGDIWEIAIVIHPLISELNWMKRKTILSIAIEIILYLPGLRKNINIDRLQFKKFKERSFISTIHCAVSLSNHSMIDVHIYSNIVSVFLADQLNFCVYWYVSISFSHTYHPEMWLFFVTLNYSQCLLFSFFSFIVNNHSKLIYLRCFESVRWRFEEMRVTVWSKSHALSLMRSFELLPLKYIKYNGLYYSMNFNNSQSHEINQPKRTKNEKKKKKKQSKIWRAHNQRHRM